jgi:hypothetical protein
VEDLPDKPADLTGEFTPRDDGFGTPGDSTFNTPPLVEAAETGPFFHNNSIETIEGAVAFYDGESFNNSPSGRFLASRTGGPIELDATQIVAIAAFLRVINALENIREGSDLLNSYVKRTFLGNEDFNKLLNSAGDETGDAIRVLEAGGLHPAAIAHLKKALVLIQEAIKERSSSDRKSKAESAISEVGLARNEMIQ